MTEARLDITDELLVAYVDDELDAPQREMVATVLAGNPSLGRRADEMRLARDLLNEAFPLQPDAEVPAPIEAAANRLAEARAGGPATSRFRYWRKYAVAAGVVLGLAAAALYLLRREDPVTALVRIDRGTPLYGVLESTPSAEVINVPAQHATLRAVLTFRAKDGRYCREFEVVAGSKGSTGIACRDRGEWRTEVLMSTAAAASSNGNSSYYTPAGEADEPAVAQVVDRLIQDDPLGAPEEARMLANGWRAAENP